MNRRLLVPLLLALLARPVAAQAPAGLADPDPGARERAAASLAAGGAAAVEPLVAALADADPFVAGAAADALARIGAASVPALVRALGDAREEVCVGAAVALGKLGPRATEAVPALAQALSNPKAVVRWTAASALGAAGRGASPALPALRDALWDRDEDVRRGATLALERIDPAAWLRAPSWEATVAVVERLVPILMREHHVPAVSVALVKDRTVAFSKAWGVADAKTGAPATTTTLFEVASMTKPAFAYVALKLVEDGKLDLDRPLAEVVDLPAVPGQPELTRITPRMVLSHTSGLPNWRPGGEERDGPLPVLFPPGSRFGYSGEAFFLLQRAFEKVTGAPLEAYAKDALFAPLGMERASFAWAPELDAALATGHDEDGKPKARARYRHANAAYTLVTTAPDYARVLTALLDPEAFGPKALSRAGVDAMLRRAVRADARDPIERPGRARGGAVFWGLGWGINETPGGDVIYHSGANQTGFRCYGQLSPSRGTGIVVLTNGLGGGALWTRLVAAIGDL
ncbi:MAG TPA: serine hydrolase [Thermoanaerobaculia bacterium]|nr:serine hydrolase [Thermoanaerobaculia bacterium]